MKAQARTQIINEMNGLVFNCTSEDISSGACIAATGDQLLETFSIPPGGTGQSPPRPPDSTSLTMSGAGKLIAIIISLVLIFRIGAWLALRIKVRGL